MTESSVKHLLRWRLDFADGSFKAGLWSSPGNHDSSRASKNLSPSLVMASIEAKDITTRQTYILVNCPANEFTEFKWTALHRVYSGAHEIAGLSLVTTKGSTEIFLDGTSTKKLSGE